MKVSYNDLVYIISTAARLVKISPVYLKYGHA